MWPKLIFVRVPRRPWPRLKDSQAGDEHQPAAQASLPASARCAENREHVARALRAMKSVLQLTRS